MILTKLTAVGTDGSRTMLWFSDGSKMRISTYLVADLGLYGGMEIDDEELAELMAQAQKASAKDRAVRIVSTTSISQKELRRRLIQRGENPEDAEAAVSWLKELGAVDDKAMARRVVESCVSKGYGEARIRQTLYEKGIPKKYWEEVLSELPDMSDAIDRFLEKRFRGLETLDQKEIKRATDALARRGHSWSDISAGLRRYQVSLEEKFFD